MGDNKANSESLESRIAKLEAALEIAEQRADALTAEISSLNADGATFRMLQDTMPLGYHNLDENGNILNVNKEWLSFFEYEMEEVIGRNFSEFLSPDIKDIFKSRFEGFKRAGIVKNVEFTVVKKSGRTATVSFNGVVSRNSDGSFDRTHCIFEDITELKKQEERHRIIAELLDITPASITIHDASGEFYYANKTTFEMHGYEPKDFYKKNIREIDAPVSRALYKERVEKLLEKGKANFEVEHIHKNGSLFPLEVNTKVVELEDKKVFLSVASDIARRKQEEARIKLFALVLSILNRGSDLDETIRVALLAIKEHLDIEAVGIRLKEGGDYPYRQTEGFSSEFVSLENNLCALDADGSVVLDNNGNPVLECMCGNVIRGIFNPDLPFFTAGGSFWTNSTSDLLASTSEADRQASTRNRFNGEGYESVALIPLKVGHETLGLLQLNDRRVGKFSLETIIFLEGLSNSIGLAASRLRSVELLRHTMEKYRIVADNTYDWENWITPEGRFIYSSPACERITGRTPEDFIADPELLLKIIHPDDREEAQSFWDEMQSTRERNDHKFRIVRPDGSIRWIGHAYKRVYGDNGEYMGLRNSFRDITNSQLKTLENEAWNASALSVLQSNNFEEAAKTIFDNAKLLTGAKSGYVALLSKDSSENEVLFLDSGGAPCDVDPLLPMPIRGLRAEAYKTGRAVYHNDFMNSEWQSMMPAGHVALKNVMFAPINIDGEVAGLIGLANKPGAFTDDDSRVAYVLSSLAAI
ncbi:MAG TPA: PAS domain S-box protein, partial [bacterium]|nr:PAS domain S-box protein [bacterium]